MVTFKNQGRYGNFLFQLATAYAYAKRHNLEFTVPTQTHDARYYPLYYPHLVNPGYDPAMPVKEVKEAAFHYTELPYHPDWREYNILLNGYFQSEKYFKEYRQEILNLFGFYNPEVKSGYTSIHVRRGDYLKKEVLDYHVVISLDYIYAAMDYIHGETGNTKFLVCSDDIAWCRDKIKNNKYEIEFYSGMPFHIEMQLLSSCDNHILSPSSFCWWSAWASQNPHKKVVYYKRHFGPRGKYNDTKDLYPEEWIKL